MATKKHQTNEERAEARRLCNRKYYEKNRDKYREIAQRKKDQRNELAKTRRATIKQLVAIVMERGDEDMVKLAQTLG